MALGLAVLAALLSVGSVAGPAAAACTPNPPIEIGLATAEVAFVGTVTSARNDNRWVTVRVEERWRGTQLPDVVEVRGGAEPGTATSTDRAYAPGRYLFVVGTGPAGVLVDSSCSLTTPWTDDLARLRPPNVQPNLTGGPGEAPTITFATVAPLAALVLALVIAVIAYLTIVRARKRPPTWVR